MDITKLRATLRPHIIALSGRNTHATLPDTSSKLCMPFPDFPDHGVSKREKITGAFDALSDDGLPVTARLYLEYYPPNARERNEIQDILWADLPTPEINKKIRREIASALADGDLYSDAGYFDELLERLWILDDEPTGRFQALVAHRSYFDRSIRALIQQHVYKNPGDLSAEDLFDLLGAFDCSDRRFAAFVEGLASSDVRPKESSQRRFVEIVNSALRGSGAELRETDSRDGYPLFSLVHTHGSASGRPKNLIFGSQMKPDMRFRDAVNNDVEIVTNADKVLIYDRPIGAEGITWADLQSWWVTLNNLTDEGKAKSTLYRRLISSLPENSPPQRLLFESYFKRFTTSIPRLPALLPEVWLHWDPKTIRERGRDALFRYRMDFLMLLPGDVRVVLEVDGKQHYADNDGRASPSLYAAMASADRDLKLAGYHVFHFGGAELREDTAQELMGAFFDAMFRRFRVSIS